MAERPSFEIRILRVVKDVGLTEAEVTLEDGRRSTAFYGTTDPEQVKRMVRTELDHGEWEANEPDEPELGR
jgi:hypothetical protein